MSCHAVYTLDKVTGKTFLQIFTAQLQNLTENEGSRSK